ncbi:MAG: Asp-tRNA(Asn)/Glu-tRNA(Gln) amidotransferase subunit GatC [Thermodesulfobacteriota bacterium]|nr:Asp-tRNA(Asn)/Glu-tRNA(Gln) amidotransferase subunit GatC [Thermodesulfobacteriota bacterium]
MIITTEEVKNVAGLARLELAEEEVKSLTEQLDKILNYVEKLNEAETLGVEPTTHAISISNAFRSDEISKSLNQEAALANGPVQNGESFEVPKII